MALHLRMKLRRKQEDFLGLESSVLMPLAVLRGQQVEDPRGGDGRLPLVPALLPADGARAAPPGVDVGGLGHPPRVLQER